MPNQSHYPPGRNNKCGQAHSRLFRGVKHQISPVYPGKLTPTARRPTGVRLLYNGARKGCQAVFVAVFGSQSKKRLY
jgi:hypothetical protein